MFTQPIGSKLSIVLWLGGAKIQAAAVVVTCTPQFGNGIKFLEMAAATSAQLEFRTDFPECSNSEQYLPDSTPPKAYSSLRGDSVSGSCTHYGVSSNTRPQLSVPPTAVAL